MITIISSCCDNLYDASFPTAMKCDYPEDDSIDVVFEVCGSVEVLQEGYRLVRPGGSYVLAGLVHTESNIDLTGNQIIQKCLTVKGGYKGSLAVI